MSFYIGKNTTGNSIVHITNGVYSEQDMKGPPMADTVLHNDLEFLAYTLYPVTLIQRTAQYTNYTPRLYYWYCSATITKTMLDYEIAYFLTSAYQQTNPWHGYFSVLPATLGSSLSYSASQSSTYYIPFVSSYGGYPPRPNVSYIVVIDTRKLISSYGCTLTPTTFTAGSLDIGNIKYVSRGKITNHPGSYIIDGFHQLVDGSAMTGSLEISSNTVLGTTIKKGGYMLIDGRNSDFLGGSVTTEFYPILGYNSKIYLFTTALNTLHRVTGSSGTISVSIDGTTKETNLAVISTGDYWNGVQWVNTYTTIRYRVEGLNVYAVSYTSSTDQSYADGPPGTYHISVEVFS